MPHVDESPEPTDNAQAPAMANDRGASAKARIGMLPTLSIRDHLPDARQVDEALGFRPEA